MKMLTMMLLGIFLASCVSIPPKPVLHYKHWAGTCSMYCFDYSRLKRVSDKECGEDFQTNERLDPSRCDGILGPDINDYAEVLKPKAIENIQYCEDLKD